MPLDTSIPLQVQVPQFMDPSRAMSLAAEQQMNALRAQVMQQEMQQNALRMQYTQEDRARAEEGRRQAAAEKAQEKALRARILQESGGDAAKASNIALRLGRPDIAESYSKGRESIAKAGTEEAGFKLKDFESAVTELSPVIASVNSPETAAEAARMIYRHPTLGKVFSQFMPETQFVADSAKGFAADPNTWRLQHSITGKDLFDTVSKFNQTREAKPTQVSAGAAVVDLNPQSPTYGQTVAKGAPSEQEIKAQTKQEGKKSIDETLASMAGEYDKLARTGGMPSEKAGWLENIPARLSASGAGQLVGANPEAQSSYQRLEGLRRDLIVAIKNATGMSAQEMNSNVELQQMLAAVTSPNQNIEAVRRRMNDISKRYGLGKEFTGEEKQTKSEQTKSAPPTNAKGWTLHTDANGNQAYVSPDGKQFEEVK